jgi:two-component system cell cycle response regulator
MSDTNAAQIVTERRKLPRRRILKAARITIGGHPTAAHCAVRDITEAGAKIRLQDATALLPEQFELVVEIDGTEANCRTIWRKGGDLGVSFLATRQTAPIRHQVIDRKVEDAGDRRDRPARS